MKIKAVRLACFSPTHTTRNVLEAIGRGTGLRPVTLTDLTPPETPDRLDFAADDLLVLGGPVYAGRLPEAAAARFRGLKGRGGPAVAVAVYGNRAFDDALVELEDIAREAGFRPLAGGAFIGEHSYSSAATPIAAGRPDAADLARAEAFGRQLRTLVDTLSSPDTVKLALPGNRPYRARMPHVPNAPVTDAGACTRCGECVVACPMAAIPAVDPTTTDATRCIACAACIKVCPVEARAITNPDHLVRIQRVAGLARERKEPETWLGKP